MFKRVVIDPANPTWWNDLQGACLDLSMEKQKMLVMFLLCNMNLDNATLENLWRKMEAVKAD